MLIHFKILPTFSGSHSQSAEWATSREDYWGLGIVAWFVKSQKLDLQNIRKTSDHCKCLLIMQHYTVTQRLITEGIRQELTTLFVGEIYFRLPKD